MGARVSTTPLAPAVRRDRLLVGLAVVLLSALALRLSTAGVQSFGDDELFTAWLVHKDFGGMLGAIPDTESTPYLYYVLAWVWARVFGFSELGLRSLSALLGAGAAWVLYLAVARAGSRRLGVAAAALVAFNPFLVWYSQEIRAYALLLLLGAATLLGFFGALDQDQPGPARARWLWFWAGASALAVATHYFALFLVGPEALWLLWSTRSRPPDLRRGLLAVALPAIVTIAEVPLLLGQRDHLKARGGLAEGGFAQSIAALPKQFLVGRTPPLELLVTALAAGLSLVMLVLFLRRSAGRERRVALTCLGLAIAVVAVPILMKPVAGNYLSSRNLILALLPALVVLAAGAVTGRMGVVAAAALCCLWLGIVVAVAANPRYQRDDWRGAAKAVGPARTDRAVVFAPGFTNTGPFRVYFKQGSLMPPAGLPVREIDVVGLAQVGKNGVGTPEPPRDKPAPAPAGFQLAAVKYAKTYSLARYVSAQPRTIGAERLRALSFGGLYAAVVDQRPAGG
ncbi:MAG: glycosyltransferase family 39 protein [Thermoleophilaceae bacterium]